MLIQLCIDLVVFLLAFYYITIIIHFIGLNIFKGKKLTFVKALIPFYAWISRNINEGNPENFVEEETKKPNQKRKTTKNK